MCCFANIFTRKNPHKPDLTGKVFQVTGGSKKMGKYVVLELASLNATILFTGNSKLQGKTLTYEVNKIYPKACIQYMYCDHLSLSSIQKLATNIKEAHHKLDCIVHNSGTFIEEYTTNDEYNSVVQSNHYSVFQQTDQLYSLLKTTKESRVIVVSNEQHLKAKILDFDDMDFNNREFDPWEAYCETKLYNILFAKSFSHFMKLQDNRNTKAISLNTGYSNDELTKYGRQWFGFCYDFCKTFTGKNLSYRSESQNVLNSILMPWEDLEAGAYYDNCRVGIINKQGDDIENVHRCWDMTIQNLNRETEMTNFCETFRLIPIAHHHNPIKPSFFPKNTPCVDDDQNDYHQPRKNSNALILPGNSIENTPHPDGQQKNQSSSRKEMFDENNYKTNKEEDQDDLENQKTMGSGDYTNIKQDARINTTDDTHLKDIKSSDKFIEADNGDKKAKGNQIAPVPIEMEQMKASGNRDSLFLKLQSG